MTSAFIEKEHRKFFSRLGFAYLFGSVIICMMQIISAVFFKIAFPDLYKQYSFLLITGAFYIFCAPAIIILIRQIDLPQGTVQKHSLSLLEFMKYFFVTYSGMYCMNLLGNFFIYMISLLKPSGQVTYTVSAQAISNPMWQNVLVMVIFAPLFEEYVFRKMLIDRLSPYGDKIAILLSGLMFSLYHGNLYQFFYTFILGICFAYVYCRTRQLLYPLVLHILINFMGSVVSVYVTKVSETTGTYRNILLFLYSFIVLSFVLIGIIIFLLDHKKIRLDEGLIALPKGKHIKTIIANPGILLFILFWSGYIIYATIN